MAHSTHPPATDVVVEGDSFALVRDVESESIDLIITSPPYWGLRTYGLDHNDDILQEWTGEGCDPSRVPPWDWYSERGGVLGMEPFPEWYVTHLVEFFGKAKRTLKADGSVWVNLGDTYFARWGSIRDNGRQGIVRGRTRRRTPSGGYLQDKQLLLIPSRFAIAMQDAGWILRNDLIWAKPCPMPRPEKDRLRLSHEHWFHFVLRQRGNRRASYYYDLTGCEEGRRDVVSHATTNGSTGHTASFPAALVRHRIASTSPKGGAVLDPFCGSGVAIALALQMGRRALGFEISKRYVELAREAIESIGLQTPPAEST